MLNWASDLIEQGRYVGNYKYVLIDEFQDFSVSKDLMVRALCKQNPAIKLFCVGDDWQSIYRFAGADVSLMTNFETNHGFTNTLKLQQTNRFDRKLARITNEFILKNPSQIKKEIQAAKEFDFDPLHIVKAVSKDDAEKKVGEILDEINKRGKETSVYFLGRYKHNEPKELRVWRRTFKNLTIKYMTAHSSKGLEADEVIVLDVVSGTYGFPSQIADDPVLKIVLSGDDAYSHAEERRLMYVALTRTRNQVYVITKEKEESVFVAELASDLEQSTAISVEKCPKCGGEIVERTSQYGAFLGCRNYPQCTWTRDKENRRAVRAFSPNYSRRSHYRRPYSRK